MLMKMQEDASANTSPSGDHSASRRRRPRGTRPSSNQQADTMPGPVAADPKTLPPASKARVLLLVSCALFVLWGLGARLDGWTFSDVATLGAALRGGSPPRNRPQVMFLGDSLTERGENGDTSGWVSRMRNHYVRSTDVVNRGFAGYNTKYALFCSPFLSLS
jgi:hypothetical protein